MYSVCAERFMDTLEKVHAGVLSEGPAGTAHAGTATSTCAAPSPQRARASC